VEARSSQDRTRTVVTYQRSGPQNVPIEGRYSFNVKRPTALVSGYEAPAEHFKEQVPTLLTVIANITMLDDQAYQRLASQSKKGGSVMLPMRKVSASASQFAHYLPSLIKIADSFQVNQQWPRNRCASRASPAIRTG
jgi:hypothetical protein